MEDILLIDDDVELCDMLTEYLGRYDLRVRAVHRGDAGLEVAKGRQWSMILLDVMLPGLDGFEVLKQIRANEQTKLLPVIILTSSREERDLLAGYEGGASSYIVKPVDSEQFEESIRQLGLYWLILNEGLPTS